MKAVKVEYTVKTGYAAQNADNIRNVMRDLKRLNPEGLQYSAFRKEDKKSFVHFLLARDEESEKILTGLDSFKHFLAGLKASEPEQPPKQERMELVAD